ncbi:MAG: energy-coupling factor ABC transporter ATP-binding protein [Deltaproteobacteria bacterium]|nr:energy-coupling factor ABC transporter ATP-binding protein [Deltaproteobacteria bacterium]
MAALIDITNLSFSYDPHRPIFESLDFVFHEGQKLGLVGKNGAGKSTLLQLIMGLIKSSSGAIEIFGQRRSTEAQFREARLQIGFVFQDANDQLFCPTVGDDIAFGPLNMGLSREEADKIVDETLALIGMESFKDRASYSLSDGEKKIVAIGTALAMRPKLLILDEPTTCLDEDACDRIAQVLLDCGLPYLIAAHDLSFLDRVAPDRARLIGGHIIYEPLASRPDRNHDRLRVVGKD